MLYVSKATVFADYCRQLGDTDHLAESVELYTYCRVRRAIHFYPKNFQSHRPELSETMLYLHIHCN